MEKDKFNEEILTEFKKMNLNLKEINRTLKYLNDLIRTQKGK